MDKVVVITGATSGIGYAAAELFLLKKWIVYACGRNEKALEDLKNQGAIPSKVDVTSYNDIKKLVDLVNNNGHIVNVLVNNAGYGQFGTIEETNDSLTRRQFDVNVFGLTEITRQFLPQMRNNNQGRIIIVSSIAGRISIPGGGWYAASKHALEAIADSLRWEVYQFGIKVSVIQPGPIKTKFSEAVEKNLHAANLNSAYGNIVEKLTSTGAKSPGGTTEMCAAKIYKAATEKNPKTRYLVTKEARLIKIILYLFPQKLIDYIIRKAIS